MNPNVKRALLAAVVAFIATLLFGTPKVVTQVLVFVSVFILTSVLFQLAVILSRRKSNIVNPKS